LAHRWQERSSNASAHALAVARERELHESIVACVGNGLNLCRDALLRGDQPFGPHYNANLVPIAWFADL
jgi:hypothetical protein